MKHHPEAIQKTREWAEAIRIIDATEEPIRLMIERDLAAVKSLRHDRIATTAAIAHVTARLMRKIAKLRRDAFKEAFRHVRQSHGIRPQRAA